MQRGHNGIAAVRAAKKKKEHIELFASYEPLSLPLPSVPPPARRLPMVLRAGVTRGTVSPVLR